MLHWIPCSFCIYCIAAISCGWVYCIVHNRILSVHVQLHLVHWNEDLYDSYEEAVKREDGIVIVAVFLKVMASSYNLRLSLLLKLIKYCCLNIFSPGTTIVWKRGIAVLVLSACPFVCPSVCHTRVN